MALLMIQPIACDHFGSSYGYELDTKQFNADEGSAIFKMCTECGIFVDDFAELFCDKCKHKLHYVDVSDVEHLRKWLNHLDLNKTEVNKSHELNVPETEVPDPNEIELISENQLISETHECLRDDNGECGEDCIDCEERKWDPATSAESDDESGFWDTYHKDDYKCDCMDWGSICDNCANASDDEYDDDQDSVS